VSALGLRFYDERLRAFASGTGAKWQMLFPKGVFHRGDFPGGRVVIDDAYVATLVRNFKKRGAPQLPVDYFHRGGSDVPVPNEQKVASGWILDVEARADGLYALISFTAAALARIKADELRHLSPEWSPDALDVATGQRQGPTLLGAGLLNDPFFKEMPRVAASRFGVPPAQPHTPAPAAKEHKSMKNIALLLAAVGLSAEPTEQEVAAVAERLKASAEEKETALKASAAVEPLKLNLEAERAARVALEQKVQSLEASAKAAETETKIVAALASPALLTRVTTPALKEGFRKVAASAGVDAATAMFKDFPEVVKLGELGHGEGVKSETPVTAFEKLKASAAAIAKDQGLGEADSLLAAMRKHPELAAQSTPTVTSRIAG